MSILAVFSLLYSLLDILGGSFLKREVKFESLESKTASGEAVFNRIKFSEEASQDVWLMKQSHNGPRAGEWDEVKIIVDKSSKPFMASYHQLKNGREVDYKASCFRCHSGGPRMIRPVWDSQAVKLGVADKIAIAKWNLKIKSYGEVLVKSNEPFARKVPLVERAGDRHRILKVESCSKCHRSGGPRAELTKANVLTMKFLMKNQMMPPWPYELSKKDKAKINRFIYGF